MGIYVGENPLSVPGMSAYQEAIKGGFAGTREDFDKALNNLPDHLADKVRHITAEERINWNNKAPGGFGGDGETLPFYDLADDTGDLLKAKMIELSNDDTVTRPFKKHFTFTAHYFLGSAWTWFGELLCVQNDSGFKRLFLHGYNFAPATQHMWMTAFENDNHEWEWNGPYWQSLDNLPNSQYLTKHIWKGQFGGQVGWHRITNNFSIYNSPCLVSISHQYYGGSSAGVLLHITPDTSVGNILCLKSNGATHDYGIDNAPIINARLVNINSSTCALDIYTKISDTNPCTISIQNEGSTNADVIEPRFISADDTLPDGETLRNTMAWQNPPLVLEQEYKTAELFNNREVYIKRVNFGNAPSGSIKEVTCATNVYELVDFNLTVWNGAYGQENTIINDDGTLVARPYSKLSEGTLTIALAVFANLSTRRVDLVVKYTKKT